MRIAKRLSILLLALLLAATVALFGACASGNDDNTNTGDDTQQGGDNTGGDNTGDDNTGDDNTGDNTGGDNTGDNTGDDNTDDDTPTVRPTIKLSSTYLQLTVDEEATEITATVENSEEDVTWRSMNTSVATVEASDEDPNVGLITAVAAGSTSVRATIGNVYATVLVSVSREITADYSEDITIDADLSDWTEAELTKTISINGDGGDSDTYADDDYKSATFHGVLDKNGLYLAVEVYHEMYQSKESTWWHNSQFEFRMGTGGALHYFVYADGDDTTFTGSDAQTKCGIGRDGGTTEMQVSWKTEKATDPQPAGTYHTIVEVFVPMGEISSYIGDAYLRVGVAWKSKDDGSGTDFDTCGNGEAAGGEPDNFWVPAGAWTDNADMPYVTEDGIYLRSEYNSLS